MRYRVDGDEVTAVQECPAETGMSHGLAAAWSHLEGLVAGAPERLEMRAAIDQVEAELMKLPQADHGLEHLFCEGLYIRVATIHTGCLFTTPIYREECVLTMLRGRLLIITEEGVKAITPPEFVVTKPGVKRLILALDEVLAHTVHPNPENTRDVEALEARIYAKSFDEVQPLTLEGAPV